MDKKILIMLLGLLLFVSIASASQNDKVNIVVLGMIGHGPMQPTINAIKEVTSKYSSVNVQWLDLESEEGQRYSQEHDLTAHLNVVINRKYQYNINGKEVTFQWFEGQQWTKEDLDAVISDILNNKGNVSPADNPKSSNSLNMFIIFGGIFAVVGAVAWFLIKKTK